MGVKNYLNEFLQISKEELRIKGKKIKLKIKFSKNKMKRIILSRDKLLKIDKDLKERIVAFSSEIKSANIRLRKFEYELSGFVKELRRLQRLIEGSG